MERELPKIAGLGEACCGCGACAAKCPKACIEMKADGCGFLRTKVDAGVCVGCGGCDSVCPAISERHKDGIESVIWAKSKDEGERLASSSGGLFALLAHDTLACGGVVCGAAWEPGCKGARHVLVESEDALDSVMRSKYVQSKIDRDVYEGMRTALRGGRRVLFAGTACQVAGVRAYLGKLADSDNYLAVDVICHGVPSPLLWEKWASWREGRVGASLYDVNMRSKTTGWLSFSAAYKYAAEKDAQPVCDGSVFHDDWYFKAFLADASLRSSCYACPAKRSCGSDITLGDFWGIQDMHPEVDHETGVSAVLCNTKKGLLAIDGLKLWLEWGDSFFEKVSAGNPSLISAVEPYFKRDEFMGDLASGTDVEGLMSKYDFKPSIGQRLLGKFGGIIRRFGRI